MKKERDGLLAELEKVEEETRHMEQQIAKAEAGHQGGISQVEDDGNQNSSEQRMLARLWRNLSVGKGYLLGSLGIKSLESDCALLYCSDAL